MHNQFAIDLETQHVDPKAGLLTSAAPAFQVASLTGTGPLTLTDEARTEIAAFVNTGGTLIVDAAGGDARFATTARAELAKIFPPPAGQAVGQLLSPQDNAYRLRGVTIEHFSYRSFARGKIDGSLKVPHLRGITIGNRVAVFFSAEDLANGLVGEETDGVIGYRPETATAIMRNILLYAVGDR